MPNELTPFLIRPTSLNESMQLSKMIASSSFCPSQMRGKPGDVILALQMGSEVGLSPMQSLQNIAVIQGKPCLYGDGALAVCMASPQYEWHEETYSGTIQEGTRKAHCIVKRKNSEPYEKTFSMDDAKKAGLWGKAGPWTQYPDRMLQMRARAFAIRDKFADALRGISIREEIEDIPSKLEKKIEPIKVTAEYIDSKEEFPGVTLLDVKPDTNPEDFFINPPIREPEPIDGYLAMINEAKNLTELESVFKEAYITFKEFPNLQESVIFAKDIKKAELEELK